MNKEERLENLLDQVRSALDLTCAEPVVGGFAREPDPNKAGSDKACWYFINEEVTVAHCGNFRTGVKHTLAVHGLNDNSSLGVDWRAATAERNNHRARPQEAVAQMVQYRWAGAKPADPEHPYLQAKQIGPDGLRQFGPNLLVPLQDITGKIWSLQSISPDGQKRFEKDGRTSGVFAIFGDINISDPVYIAEGVATASTFSHETGKACVAAMSAGNLQAVCKDLRQALPEGVDICVVADNDHRTKGNPGLTQGNAAAKAIGGHVIFPHLPCRNPDCKCSDFNDVINCKQHVRGEL